MAKNMGSGAEDDEDVDIFGRNKEANALEQQVEESEQQQPAEFDGGILLLDAEEAIHSIMDDESQF